MTMPRVPDDPEERSAFIVTALMRTYHINRPEARSLLLLHNTDVLRELDEKLVREKKEENPYATNWWGTNLGRKASLWIEGMEAAQDVLFAMEMRLHMAAGAVLRATRRGGATLTLPEPTEEQLKTWHQERSTTPLTEDEG